MAYGKGGAGIAQMDMFSDMVMEDDIRKSGRVKVKTNPKRVFVQADLFESVGLPESRTTAIYPNRIRDKWHVETVTGLREFGDELTEFSTPLGNAFAKGYVRIVYGDHGPYVEFARSHIVMPLGKRFQGKGLPLDAYYEWLVPSDASDVKIYDQKRDVKDVKNPPSGGFSGNRTEGYADYVPGMIYVSPFELKVSRR